jgi:hypothetical protein
LIIFKGLAVGSQGPYLESSDVFALDACALIPAFSQIVWDDSSAFLGASTWIALMNFHQLENISHNFNRDLRNKNNEFEKYLFAILTYYRNIAL